MWGDAVTDASYAEKARARKMADALAIGIDDMLISDLVERFYGSIRSDKLLGPIFEQHVADWVPHLARMKDFWASVTLESGRYRAPVSGIGKPYRIQSAHRHTGSPRRAG